jgi:hypothetical protein
MHDAVLYGKPVALGHHSQRPNDSDSVMNEDSGRQNVSA